MENRISPKREGRGFSLTILLAVGKCISLHMYLQMHSAGISCSPICGKQNRYWGEMVHTMRTVPQNNSRVITVTNLRQSKQSWHFSRTKRYMCTLHHVSTLHWMIIHMQISCRHSTTDVDVLSGDVLVFWTFSTPNKYPEPLFSASKKSFAK